MKNLRLFALLLLLMSLSACADGSTGYVDPPDTPSQEMTWGDGNWDETNWPAEEPLTS